MPFVKLTYSGTVCKNYLYFSFDADLFDVELVTLELNIQPTLVKIKSDPVPKKTCWNYQIDAGDDIILEPYLEKLLDTFESKIDVINQLKQKFKLRTRLIFVIDIDINPDASTPTFGLNKRAIGFLSETETLVDFDLYKADTIGLLNKSDDE